MISSPAFPMAHTVSSHLAGALVLDEDGTPVAGVPLPRRRLGHPILRPMPGLFRPLRHLVAPGAPKRHSPAIGVYYFAPCDSPVQYAALGPYEWCTWPICPQCAALHPSHHLAWRARS